MRLVEEAVAFAVEAPVKGVLVIRVAGILDRSSASRLIAVLDSQLQFRSSPADQRYQLVVDLANVRLVGPGGIDALRHARNVAEQTSMTLQLTGLTARSGRLPEWAAELIAEFRTFADLDHLLAFLDSAEAGQTENLATHEGLPHTA